MFNIKITAMKKIIMLCVAVVMSSVVALAQDPRDLAKQQKELNEIHAKMINQKPLKDAKKQAKKLRKDGFEVPAGNLEMEKQITYSMLLKQELMLDEAGSPVKRYMTSSGNATAGTFKAARAAARESAMADIAANIETKLASAMQSKVDNAQSNSEMATTVDKYNERSKAIVRGVLTRSITTLVIFRELPNKNINVQLEIAFDKKELAAQLKRKMQEELEKEGDEALGEIVDEALNSIE